LSKYGPKFLVEHEGVEEKYVLYNNLVRGFSRGSLKASLYGIKDYKKLYSRWAQIMKRCYDKSCPVYSSYGGRGILMSEEFKDHLTFIRYISELPGCHDEEKYQLDRIDNSKGYERGNLRWVSPQENNRNKRTNRIVELYGEKLCITDFLARCANTSRTLVTKLFRQGFTAEQIYEFNLGRTKGKPRRRL